MLKNYFTITLRYLRRNAVFTTINLFGLALGLATCLLILLFVQHELSYDRYNEKADRIVRVVLRGKMEGGELKEANVMPPVAQTLKKESEQALAALAGVRSTKVVIDITNPPEVASGGQTGTTKITGVKYVIAIASGKGGVGKSTVAANLAAALDRSGAEVHAVRGDGTFRTA